MSTEGSQEPRVTSRRLHFLPICIPSSPSSISYRKEGEMQILHRHTHTYCKHTQCLSSPARHGHGDFDRLLAEHPPGYRIVCSSGLFPLLLPSLISSLLSTPVHTLLSSISPSLPPLLCPVLVSSSPLLLSGSTGQTDGVTDSRCGSCPPVGLLVH